MPAVDGLLPDALRVLLEAMDRSVVIAGPDGAVLQTNRRARALLGWDGPEGVASRSVDAIQFPRALRARLRRDPGPWEQETTIKARGRATPVLVAKHPLTGAGRPGGSVVLITDLREVGSAIAQRDRARQNDRAKTRSLYMVAHDMSGPITVLNGYVSLVQDGTLRAEQLDPYVPMLADQLTHIQRLVNVLLDTARLEEGRLELRLEPLDLVAFVDDLVNRIRSPETGHRFVVRRQIATLPILGDPIRLDSIIRNVISNALKYSPEGTDITCTLRSQAAATLEVADEGDGIEAADLDRLFTRFGRVGDVAANPPGVGLGLFMSRELARLHGGDLEAASEVGRGSRFTLRLPLRD